MTTPAPAPRLSDHGRLDVLLDERERCMTDLASATDLLFSVAQADGPDEMDLALRRVRRFLLLTP